MEFLGYELDYSLGATRKIRAKFDGKNFMDVLQIDHDIDGMIKVIHACVKDDIKYKEFEEEVFSSDLGVLHIVDAYKALVMKIMNPGQDVEVTEKELGKLAEKAQD